MIMLYGVLDKKEILTSLIGVLLSELSELDLSGVYLIVFEPTSDLQSHVVQNVIWMEIVRRRKF